MSRELDSTPTTKLPGQTAQPPWPLERWRPEMRAWGSAWPAGYFYLICQFLGDTGHSQSTTLLASLTIQEGRPLRREPCRLPPTPSSCILPVLSLQPLPPCSGQSRDAQCTVVAGLRFFCVTQHLFEVRSRQCPPSTVGSEQHPSLSSHP